MLTDKLLYFSEKTPDKLALKYKGKQLTYSELYQNIVARVSVLAKLYSNQVFLLNSTSELENLLNFLAIIAHGKRAIFCGKHQTQQQIAELELAYHAVVLQNISIETCPKPSENTTPFVPTVAEPSGIFLGVLSSGSTGQAKVIWKDYQSWFSAFAAQSQVFGLSSSSYLFVLDALAYSANLNNVMHCLWAGASVYLASLNTANTWAQKIENEQVDAIFLVPSHYRLLPPKAVFDKVKVAISAGEKLSQELCSTLLHALPNALLTEYYGTAELGHICYQQGQQILENPLAVGGAFPGVKLRFENDKIYVNSPYVSPEYRANPTSHDLGYMLGSQLVLLGRQGRKYNRRGLNVYAEEIENVASKISFVAEVAVVGLLQADLSHQIVLYFVHKQGYQSQICNKQVIRYLSDIIHTAKLPNRVVELQVLPRKHFGKIDHQALVRLCEAEHSVV
jgi:long-chain acyl-CoA synthetase